MKVSDIHLMFKAQFEAAFSTVPVFPKAFLQVLSGVLAGITAGLYKYAGYSLLQYFVAYADFKETVINGRAIRPLVEWGRLVGVGDPDPAVRAEFTISITVTAQGGSLLPGERLACSDNGVTYTLLSGVTLDAATVTGTVRAVSDGSGGDGSGEIGNLPDGATLTFISPLGNVSKITTITDCTVTGVDGETEGHYRQRVADRFTKRPQGGAYADYVLWGSEVAGIYKIYPYTGSVPGTVELYIESIAADRVPTSQQIQDVVEACTYDSAGQQTRKPANALILGNAALIINFSITIEGLTVASAEDAIEAAIEEYLLLREPFIDGVSILPRKDVISVSAIAGVVYDVAASYGGYVSSVSLYDTDDNAVTVYQLGKGEKPLCTGVTFA